EGESELTGKALVNPFPAPSQDGSKYPMRLSRGALDVGRPQRKIVADAFMFETHGQFRRPIRMQLGGIIAMHQVLSPITVTVAFTGIRRRQAPLHRDLLDCVPAGLHQMTIQSAGLLRSRGAARGLKGKGFAVALKLDFYRPSADRAAL